MVKFLEWLLSSWRFIS